MNMRLIFQHAVVVFYIAMTLAGLSYTLLRYSVPGVPWQIRRFSYGMMAPFQNYLTSNEELIAEGRLVGGDWQRIDIDPYFPFIRGEKAMRSYLVSFRNQGDDIWPEKYRQLARSIQLLEADEGRQWESVKLGLEKWPMSTGGYAFLRIAPFITYTSLVQIP